VRTERAAPPARTPVRALAALALLGAGGCAGTPSFHAPAGTNADALARLGTVLLAISCLVVAVVSGLVVVASLRRRGTLEEPVRRGGDGLRWILAGGVVVPAIVLVAVFVFTVGTLAAVERPPRAGPTIDVVGHRWWWEVRYDSPDPALVFTDANEIHVPVGTPVRVRLTSPDVIHSFWVPQLGGKTDVIPGQRNETWIEASRPGVFWGQCAEYCGLQHAHMSLRVVAQTPADFARWIDRARTDAPSAAPPDPLAARGKALFEGGPCAACHTVRGTTAGGVVGPDLTHLGARTTLASGTLPNTPGNLAAWIADAQAVKPGNDMPTMDLRPDDVRALVAYLESLK
jgi:cytochrome c oxidase subunit 2